MTLEELLWVVNDNTYVEIYSAESNDKIAEYDGKEAVPERYNDFEVSDIFVDGNSLCVEIVTQ